jgi:hypothetical protein
LRAHALPLLSPALHLQNAEIEYYYPPELFRDDVGAVWYADIGCQDGRLRQLTVTPTRLK